MYSFTTISPEGEESTTKKGKGVPKQELAIETTTFEHYERMVTEPYDSRITFRSMMSKDHSVSVRDVTRKKLSSCNDKVFNVTPLESRPLGHWRNSLRTLSD